MDDLDHSMRIAESDWTCFCDESEECDLLRASLACPDDTGLSDSEDSETSSLRGESGAAGEERCGKLSEGGAGGEPACPAGDPPSTGGAHAGAAEETRDSVANTLQTDTIPVQGSGGAEGLKEEEEEVEEEGDLPTGVDEAGNEPRAAEAPRPRAEKERWFVTVNDSPARERARATPAKKKRRQKKTCKKSHTCGPGREKPAESGLGSQVDADKNECEGGRDTGGCTQSEQNLGQNSVGQIDPECVSDPSQMSCEEDSVSEKPVTFNPHKENITEPTTDGDKHEARDAFPPGDPWQPEGAESEGFEDCDELLSAHSCDSETYLSAAESLEDTRHLVSESADLKQARRPAASQAEVARCGPGAGPLSCGAACERADAEQPPTLTLTDEGPGDGSARDDNVHGAVLHAPQDTPGMNLSGDRPPGPDTRAEAAGRARPVFAISAFWDEMEKLTINDILQLRTGGLAAQEAATADESPSGPGSPVDTAECASSDGGPLDTSDAADSDYFTQPDESRPDRSSCEFSTSDFEEEYWQLIGAGGDPGGDPSPDPHSRNQQWTRTSSQEEEGSTSSEGKMTRSKSLRDVQTLNTDLTSALSEVGSGLFLSGLQPLGDSAVWKATNSLGTLAPFLCSADAVDEHYQISFPGVFEYFFPEDTAQTAPGCVAVYDPDDLSAFDYSLCPFRDETRFFSARGEGEPIPIFSCSRPAVRELTFPKQDYVFLTAAAEVDDLSPIRLVSGSFLRAGRCGSSGWMSLLATRRIRFHDKGSIWSGAWASPAEARRTEARERPVTVPTEGTASSAPAQWFGEAAVQPSIMGTIHATRRDGVFSTLKQSDMCLVCIAFASWVLRSSDPESADAWKAALLANVSALSAIQYLRQYVKKRTPPQDDP